VRQARMNAIATASTPNCPHCAKPMRLARTIPRLGGLPELRTYECRACGVTFTEAVDAAYEADASHALSEAV